MNTPKLRRLDGSGFSHHLLMPILAVAAVAVIGGLTLRLIHAATLSVNLYQGHCAQQVALTQAQAGSADRTCTQQVQDLINIYQYAATGHFAIPGNGETFSYEGRMTMVVMNGSYNGATQSAVNTLAGSPNLTNAAVSGSTVTDGTWQKFCTTVAGKLGTPAFTSHSSYDFSPTKTKASGYYIGSAGTTIFGSVCGTDRGKSFATGSAGNGTGAGSTSTTISSSQHVCTSYTFAASSSSMSSSLTKPAPADCVRFIQAVLNGVYQSNYKGTYDSHADSFSSQTGTTKGLLTVDGSFGAATQSQVQAFQAAYNNLGVDGKVGASTWAALCGEAMSFKPDSATWKERAYQSAVNVFSGQSKPWTGCSASAKQATYGIHATAPTVGVPVETNTGNSSTSSNSESSGSRPPLITSFNFSLRSQDPNPVSNGDLYGDGYLATWTSTNSSVCGVSVGPSGSHFIVSDLSSGANGSARVSLDDGFAYTITLKCVSANGGTAYAYHGLTAPTP